MGDLMKYLSHDRWENKGFPPDDPLSADFQIIARRKTHPPSWMSAGIVEDGHCYIGNYQTATIYKASRTSSDTLTYCISLKEGIIKAKLCGLTTKKDPLREVLNCEMKFHKVNGTRYIVGIMLNQSWTEHRINHCLGNTSLTPRLCQIQYIQ